MCNTWYFRPEIQYLKGKRQVFDTLTKDPFGNEGPVRGKGLCQGSGQYQCTGECTCHMMAGYGDAQGHDCPCCALMP